jgi:hypothetical protein
MIQAVRTAAVCVALALAVTACASDGDSDAGRSDEPTSDSAPGPAGEPASFASASVLEGTREVVSTAQLEVSVDDVGAASDDAVGVADSVGGLLFSEQSDFGATAEATLTLKVPPGEFAKVLDRLAELGDLQHQDIATDDVTAQLVDLESRIATAEASVERLRGFLEEAGSIEQITSLERELVARETELETLAGSQRAVESQVALATVTLHLVEAGPSTSSVPSFLDGLSGGWEALQGAGAVVLVVTGALLPFVPFALAAVVVARYVTRRRRATAT